MNKQQIFKIAGVKNEKEFYAKYPNTPDGEKAFMAKYGAKIKKAQNGLNTQPEVPPVVDYEDQTYETYKDRAQGYAIDEDFLEKPAMYEEPKTYMDQQQQQVRSAMDDQIWADLTNIEDESLELEPWMTKGDVWRAPAPKKANLNALPGAAGKIAGAIGSFRQEKKDMMNANMWDKVSGVALDASQTKPEYEARDWVRPEDAIQTARLGKGANPLAKNGKKIKKANFGGDFLNMMNKGGGSETASNLISGAFKHNAGAQLGEGVGQALKVIPGVGPVVSAVAGPVLTAIGGALDPFPRKTEKYQASMNQNIDRMALNTGIGGIQNQHSGVMKDGGKIDKYAMGGDLELYNGKVETLANNPYSDSETAILRGPSHKDKGVLANYGGQFFEGEKDEPLMEIDKNGEKSLIVLGKVGINEQIAQAIGDPKTKGKTMKRVGAEIGEEEAKQTAIIKKNTKELAELNPVTQIDKLTTDSYKYNMQGADQKLKKLDEKKTKLIDIQTEINKVADARGIDAAAMMKGKIKKADNTTTMPKAEDGNKFSLQRNITGAPEMPTLTLEQSSILDSLVNLSDKTGDWTQFQEYFHEVAPVWAQYVNSLYPVTNFGKGLGLTNKDLKSNEDGIFDKRTAMYRHFTNNSIQDPVAFNKNKYKAKPEDVNINYPDVDPVEHKFKWENLINEAIPYLRPSNARPIDPGQFTGEMSALATNQIEPVEAQKYHPNLSSPYTVSFQDQLNENQADFRSTQRMLGYNPAAQNILNAQKYKANQKILGDQFRTNQAIEDKVYGENRDLLNDAQFKNLGILDQQYVRQGQAKSNTKATTLAALSSISGKNLEHNYENNRLKTLENLYNYRFGKNQRAQNWNPLATFNTEGNFGANRGATSGIPDDWMALVDRETGEFQGTKRKTTKTSNGGIIKTLNSK